MARPSAPQAPTGLGWVKRELERMQALKDSDGNSLRMSKALWWVDPPTHLSRLQEGSFIRLRNCSRLQSGVHLLYVRACAFPSLSGERAGGLDKGGTKAVAKKFSRELDGTISENYFTARKTACSSYKSAWFD